MLATLLRPLRATGADLPYGRPEAGHPGVALESWFWRLVDPGAGQVVVLAATAVREPGGGTWLSVVLAAQHPDGTRSVVERALPSVENDARTLRLAADDGEGATLRVSRDRLQVDLGPAARIDAHLDQAWHWPRRSLGGLGLGHVVPRLSQYWHPHLLGGAVRGSARFGERELPLNGSSAYAEKNWGRGGTPRAWWWGQATCAPDVVLAFAGGVLDVGPARIPATAVVVRVGDDLAAFSPPLAFISSRVDPSTWALDARTARWKVRVRATAAGRPFDFPVPVPGEHRTAPLSHQHQDGRLELTVWRDGRQRFRGESAWAGLERGGRELVRATG